MSAPQSTAPEPAGPLPPAAPKSPRDAAIDVAKGISISLVVLGHAIRGLLEASIAERDSWVGAIDSWLFSFRIPLFMFLAGLFVVKAVRRQGRSTYVANRFADLMWVYLVWTIINGVMQVLFDSITNGERGWANVAMLWVPYGHMWFLPSLAVATAVVVFLQPWTSRFASYAVVLAALLLSLETWETHASWPWDWVRPELYIFFLLGVLIEQPRLSAFLAKINTALMAVAVVVFGTVSVVLIRIGAPVPNNSAPPTTSYFERGLGIACAFAGIIAALAFAGVVARKSELLSRGATYLGRRSMGIYVSHTVFTAGVRAGLMLLGVEVVGVYVVLGLLAGIIVPVVAYNLTKGTKLDWLYTRPRLKRVKAT